MPSLSRFNQTLVLLTASSVLGLAGCGGGGAAPTPAAPQPNPAPALAPSGAGGAGGESRGAAPVASGVAGASSNPLGATAQGGGDWANDEQAALRLIAESVTLKNNLKTIVRGLHDHHDMFASFLPNVNNPKAYDAQHRPKFSWRVALLPFIGESGLYNQYNFDEPWDSEQNKSVLAQMPDVYRTPGDAGTNTRFEMVVGEGAAMQPGQREARMRDFADGTSNTLLVAHVGADKAVPWTKPDDLPYGPLNVRAMFGNIGDSLLFATADGEAHKIPADAPDDVLRNLITPNDGNPIDLASLEQLDAPLPWLSAAPRSGPLATSYMPDDCFGVLVLRVKRLMGSDLFRQNVPPEVPKKAAAEAELPVDPQSVEEIVVWLTPPDPTADPDDPLGRLGGVAFRSTEPFEFPPGESSGTVSKPSGSFFAAPIEEPAVPSTSVGPADDAAPADDLPVPSEEMIVMGGVSGKPQPDFSPEQVYRPDDRTVILGSPFRLYKLLSGKQPPAALAKRTAGADGDLVILIDTSDGKLLERIGQALPQDDERAQAAMLGLALALAPIANSNLVEINLDLSGENLLALRTECKTPQDAQMFQQQMQGFAQMGRQQEGSPPAAGAILDQLKFSANGTTGVVALPRNDAVVDTIVGAITAAVMEGMQQGRAAGQNARLNNKLKQIGLGYFNMYDAHNGPRPWSEPKDLDAKGKPYLSWRVHMLAFLDENALYEQFHLDEPWNSEHNKELLDSMPDVYSFSDEGDPTKTQAVFITGPQTMFDGKLNGQIQTITDGTSNTILCLIVPAENAVPWTQPVDVVFDPDDPLSIVRPIPPEGIRVLFGDGHTATLPADIDADTFKALVTPAGGEPVETP